MRMLSEMAAQACVHSLLASFPGHLATPAFSPLFYPCHALLQVLRGEPFTEACDVYSFGVVLHELLHRARPYADADVPIYLLMMSLASGNLRLPAVREDTTGAAPGVFVVCFACSQ